MRSFTPAPPAVAAALLFAACVNLTPNWEGSTGGQGGRASSDTATGGSGGAVGPDAASAGSGGSSAAGGIGGAGGHSTTGGTSAAGSGGATGGVVADAGSGTDAAVSADRAIDVPYSADVSLPLDRGTGGTGGGSGSTDAGVAGSGGTAGQAGGAGGGTGGTGTLGGSAVPDAAVAGSAGGTSSAAGSGGGGGAGSGGTVDAGATGGSGGSSTTPPPDAATTTCTPVPKSIGGISCPGGYCTVGTYSGYDFSFADPTGKSSVCVSAGVLCGAGVVGAQDPPGYTVWGAGFGFNLSLQTTLTTSVPVQLSGTSVTVKLSSLPTGADMRVQVLVNGVAYCAVMTMASQTILWNAFNTKCWAPTTGTALTGPPNTPNIQFQASSRATAGSFDFCVTSLSFQ